ncbi:MAG: hypothetical protein N3D82_01165 [Ignisphaera sp.]|nr:hypothetical protein [Ignisphaera sp.]MCX8167626.1 hypothetical protein [Ignisphaera sp.]MDW8085963.1 hypothetical protein [Ignisphaera sp.]
MSRSLFLYGFSEARQGSVLLYGLFTLSSLYIIVVRPYASLILLMVVTIYYTIFRIHKLLLYAALVASLPSVWMGLTGLLMAAPIETSNPWSSFLSIFLRGEVGAVLVFSFIQTLNLSELASVMGRVSRRLSFAQLLTFRVAAQLLRESSEMIAIHRLKGEKTWKTLSMLFIRGEEAVQYFTEGTILKYYQFKETEAIYSRRALILQSVMTTASTVMLLAEILNWV